MKVRQDTVTGEFQKSSVAVSDLTNELAMVSDALEEIKVSFMDPAHRCSARIPPPSML